VTIPAPSSTGSENPVIADLDLDGVAEFITVGDDLNIYNSNGTWAGADTFWNVHGFNHQNANQQTRDPAVAYVTKTFRSTPVMRYWFTDQLPTDDLSPYKTNTIKTLE